MPKSIALLLAIPALLVSTGTVAEDIPLCDLEKVCPLGGYHTIGKNALCKALICSDEAPPAVDFDCSGGPLGFNCEAWPQGEGLEYQWASSGWVSWPGWQGHPYASVSCVVDYRPIDVMVTVRSPYGLSSFAGTSIQCGVERVPE